MSNDTPDLQLLRRDGASQASRVQAALAPEYVRVDERSYQDLLAFVRAYARELRYYDADNQPMGDWRAFLPDDPAFNLDEVVAFMDDPTRLQPERALLYARPHVVLLLAFLHLLRHAQDHLNTLTQRHLDFYYQQVLRLTKKPGRPDQVNVLIDVATTTADVLLTAGTLLYAGKDSLGQDLFYRTDHDLVANRAQVAQVRSVYVARRIIGIQAAREEHTGPRDEAFMRMLQIALGDPHPGDPLPQYATGETVDYAYLRALHRLVEFVHTGLSMTWSDFRSLMALKRQRDAADAEWTEVNSLLEKAGKQRTNDSAFQLRPADPRAFEANLSTALGGPPNFDGLPLVDTITELYEQRLRQDVQQYIRDRLYFDNINDFIRLMQLKVRIDNAWQEINRIIEKAGQARSNDPSYRLAPADPTAFETNLTAALGPLDYASLPGVTTLDDYEKAVLRLEAFFFMAAEDFADLMGVAETPAAPPAWASVYAILAEAYREKVYTARRTHVQTVRETDGFAAMLGVALGEEVAPAAQDAALEELQRYVKNAPDFSFLQHISQQVTTGASIPPDDWERVYRIVEIAQRVREGGSEPVAQQETWLNLYPAADATAVQVTLGVAAEQEQQRWKTFGQAPSAAPQVSPPPPAGLGWAISSPVLALQEGQRTITLTLGLQPEQFRLDRVECVQQALQVQVSTARGWIEPGTVAVTIGDYHALSGLVKPEDTTLPALQFVLTFADHVAALASLPREHASIDSPWPVLRLMLRQIWQPENATGTTGGYITHYQPFKDLRLVSVHLKVQVVGLTAVQMQNEATVLQANRPFEPFGANPVVGSRLYLGHPEVVYKTLDSLQFHIEWMGAPGALTEHYKNYPEIAQATQSQTSTFTVQVSLVDTRREVPLTATAPLFAVDDARQPHTIDIPDVPTALHSALPGYHYTPLLEMAMGADVQTWDRYLQWELNAPDFQHGAFPTVATQKALELAAAIANKQATTAIDASAYQVNPPYTPKVKRLSLDYTSSVVLPMSAYQPGAQQDRILHVHPFGYTEAQPEARAQQCLLFPQYDNEGELYIGLRDLRPPQHLALLFQMAEGSADPDLVPVPVQWSYLSDNRWLSLDEGKLLRDTTRGLINAGIIALALPPAAPSTLLPPNLYWLRAALPRHSNSVCDTIALHTQAVSATFEDHGNAPEHLCQPLPAGSITRLAERLPTIAGLRQPYTSYGGKVGEQDSHFYTRVSERLRHKHRALTIWDYEHLILERFPQVYKVKCLPADPVVHPDAPGRVDIVVIPDIRNQLPFNPFEPKAPADLLADIAAYLADHTSAWASVQVKNAHYVPVKVRFAVRFLPGYNEGFYQQRLNDELNRFLSPWAYEEGADIEIGGKIYANVLVNFLEERSYVDYVADIKLFSSEDGRTFQLAVPSGDAGYWVQTDRPDGILVAAPQHEMDLISEAGYEARVFIGINYMKLELDFIVG